MAQIPSHITTPSDDELARWLTLERIAGSDLLHVLFSEMNKGTWSHTELTEILNSALQGFANGCCYFLASAVATRTGWSIQGFMRPNGKELIHAVLCEPSGGYAFDIVGRRRMADIQSEIEEAVGPHRIVPLPKIENFDPIELEILTEIAEGLPWMPIAQAPVSRKKWGMLLNSYVEARLSLKQQAGLLPV